MAVTNTVINKVSHNTPDLEYNIILYLLHPTCCKDLHSNNHSSNVYCYVVHLRNSTHVIMSVSIKVCH